MSKELNEALEEAATAVDTEGTETSAPPAGTGDGSSEGHEEKETSLIDQLKAGIASGEISTADLQFLDRHFQSSFNKRVDRLDRNIGDTVKKVAAERGIELPAGKTVMDLMTENDGKPFAEFMRNLIQNSNAPIQERLDKADEEDALRTRMAEAQNSWPDVKKHFPKILEIIDSSELLTRVAKKDKGEALPLIMLGVSKDIELQNERAKNARMMEIMKKAGIATKVGESTTKAKTATQPPKDTEKPKTLRGIAEAAAEAMSEFGGAN